MCEHEEIQPMVDGLIEGTQQSRTIFLATDWIGRRISFKQFLRFANPLVTEIIAQDIGHLPPVPLLLTHDSHRRFAIIFRRRRIQKVPLLFHTCEFRIPLNTHHVDDCIPNRLLGNLHSSIPLWHPFKITKFNGVSSGIPIEFDFKTIVS